MSPSLFTRTVDRRASRISEAAGVVVLVVAVVLIAVTSILRYVFGGTIDGVLELTGYALLWITMLVAVSLEVTDTFFDFDSLTERFRGGRGEVVFEVLRNVVCIAVFAGIAFLSIGWVQFNLGSTFLTAPWLDRGLALVVLPISFGILALWRLKRLVTWRPGAANAPGADTTEGTME